jgi:hypothetical protein
MSVETNVNENSGSRFGLSDSPRTVSCEKRNQRQGRKRLNIATQTDRCILQVFRSAVNGSAVNGSAVNGSAANNLPALGSCGILQLLPLVAILVAIDCPKSTAKDYEKRENSHDLVIELEDKRIAESSGLATSRRKKNRFWTHNDSGDGPWLFAFDSNGNKTGQCRLPEATSIDWEDMASYLDQDTARLVVADCGDNDAKRKSIFIYLFDEPDPDSKTQIDHFTKLELQYSDGPQNCEALAVDTERGELVLLSKNFLPLAGLYRTPIPKSEANSIVHVHATAPRSKTIPIPMITAMDIDDLSGDVWVGTYFDLFCFSCPDRTQPLDQQLAVLPKQFAMPKLKQIEALTVDSQQQVHVTSEGKPARMARVTTKIEP